MSYIGEFVIACIISGLLGWLVNLYLGIGFFAVSLIIIGTLYYYNEVGKGNPLPDEQITWLTYATTQGVGLEEIYPDRRDAPPPKLRTPKAPSLPW